MGRLRSGFGAVGKVKGRSATRLKWPDELQIQHYVAKNVVGMDEIRNAASVRSKDGTGHSIAVALLSLIDKENA